MAMNRMRMKKWSTGKVVQSARLETLTVTPNSQPFPYHVDTSQLKRDYRQMLQHLVCNIYCLCALIRSALLKL